MLTLFNISSHFTKVYALDILLYFPIYLNELGIFSQPIKHLTHHHL